MHVPSTCPAPSERRFASASDRTEALALHPDLRCVHETCNRPRDWSYFEFAPGSPVDAALSARKLTRRTAVRVHSFMAVPALLLDSDMVAAVPESFAGYVMRTHPLQSVPIPLELPGFDLFLSWHERTDKDLAHRWMREAIGAEARRFARSWASAQGHRRADRDGAQNS